MPMPELPKDLSRLSLAEIADMVRDKRLPPVDSWSPEKIGHIDMRIARDGSWFHEGGLIQRETMVRLFSTLLRREGDGRYWLVTPAEKLEIIVEDTPFVAVEVKSEGVGRNRQLAFRLNTGDLVIAGPEHCLRFDEQNGEPHPLLHVRGGMDARIGRAAYYALVDWAMAEEATPLGLWSGGQFFPMEPA